jgi:hypothetical protein
VDEITLKQRATNKQIQILDSITQPYADKRRTTMTNKHIETQVTNATSE